MYKIAILGCENSHADAFLKCIYGERNTENGGFVTVLEPTVSDVEVVGVYSDEEDAMKRLNEAFGVPMMNSYDELVGKVDGIIITARHGDNHFKYAKPYIPSKIPMFIDKPITISEKEAKEFMTLLKQNNIKVCGGSVCGTMDTVQKCKEIGLNKENGAILGGTLRAPMDEKSNYGGFFFYSQHLVQMMCEIFGYYPNSVTAIKHEKQYNCFVNYDSFDVSGTFVNGNYIYYAGIDTEKESYHNVANLAGESFIGEFMAYYNLLTGGKMTQSYEDFFAPVFVLNAIVRSIGSGKCENVKRLEDIK